MAPYWCDTFLSFFPLSKLVNLHASLISFSLFSVHTLTLRSQAWLVDIQSGLRCGHLSVSFRFVCATGEVKERRSRRDEDWLSAWRQCLRWSIAPCILDRCGPINRYQSTMSSPMTGKRNASSSSTGVLSSSPQIFDAFGRDLFHVLRLKLDDLRHRRLYFDLTLFPYFSHFRRYVR